ncbi:hypothetical protein A9P82_09040 [Arachidicoccus ginsenosidimutans]|uniref:sensor histidine kinase n=1 Tax=Arachidicoccus sp. BS20 TaxID=1850526 RepID=UPI0007F0A3AE|nr:HAMP domain-containing sensor histidine kinase [Arachidicoccus sp. BS20]ANI89427.1 hypothetical protein A9P82_09040 [Arachidicoccus sp. BS20]
MKLINKISIRFLGVVLLLTPVCVIISYNSIRNKIDNTQIARMKTMNDNVAQLLKEGKISDNYTLGKPIQITKLNSSLPSQKVEIINGSRNQKDVDKKGCLLTVNSFYNINGSTYKITSYNYTTNESQIFWGMMYGMTWKLLLIIIAIIIMARIMSKKMFAPFRESIHTLSSFNLKNRQKIQLPKSNIKELQELNSFIQNMTNKAVEDYNRAREFSENASHELQTPLAVMRTKMELLAETNITEEQAALIADMQNAIEKLSSINRSLVLLSKLDNHEFSTQEQIKFCRITRSVLSMYEDWISLKELCVSTKLDSNIILNIHPSLAEILVANLVSNAIRHNIDGGKLDIVLTNKMLRICNTGEPLDIPHDDIFRRFKKGNQSSDGIGLGLSIVQQICNKTNFFVNYNYINQQHTFSVYFDKNYREENVVISEEKTVAAEA